MSRIMSREGARPQVSGVFFKVVVQLLFLFGSDTWLVTTCMGRFLGGVPIKGGTENDGLLATSDF